MIGVRAGGLPSTMLSARCSTSAADAMFPCSAVPSIMHACLRRSAGKHQQQPTAQPPSADQEDRQPTLQQAVLSLCLAPGCGRTAANRSFGWSRIGMSSRVDCWSGLDALFIAQCTRLTRASRSSRELVCFGSRSSHVAIQGVAADAEGSGHWQQAAHWTSPSARNSGQRWAFRAACVSVWPECPALLLSSAAAAW